MAIDSPLTLALQKIKTQKARLYNPCKPGQKLIRMMERGMQLKLLSIRENIKKELFLSQKTKRKEDLK